MATLTDTRAVTATLSGTTQDVVTLTGAVGQVEIVNTDNAEDLWAHIGDTDPGAIAVGGNGLWRIRPGKSFVLRTGGWLPTIVRLLGNGQEYTVQGGPFSSVDLDATYHPNGTPVATADGGLPTGGASGKILAKASGSDFDTEWITPPVGGGGLPAGIYIDEYGNHITGASNIAAFPTDRAGELSGVIVDSTSVFTPPPAGIEVHGLHAIGGALVDLSGLQAAASVVRGVIVSGEINVTLADNGVIAMIFAESILLGGKPGGDVASVSVLSGGTYRSIIGHGPQIAVSAGLAGVKKIDGFQTWGGYLIVSGDANLEILSSVQPGESDWTFSSDTSPTQIWNVHGQQDANIENTSAGTGRLRVSYLTGTGYNIQHGTTSGTGQTNVTAATARILGTLNVSHTGIGNGNLTVSGAGHVDVSELHSNISLTLNGARVLIADVGSGGGVNSVSDIEGAGRISISNLDGGLTLGQLRVDGTDNTDALIINAATATSITKSQIGAGAQVTVAGGTITQFTVAPGAVVDTGGKAVANCRILDGSYNNAFTNDNVNTYCYAVGVSGLDTLVDV